MIAWSMTTFKTLDLGNSNAWKDVHDRLEHDYLPDIRLGEFQCLEGDT